MIPVRNILFISLISALFSLLACEEYTDWEFQLDPDTDLVVQAILTDEFKYQEIWLSESHYGRNGDPVAVTDAIVTVQTNGVVAEFINDPTQPGRYISKFPFKVFDHLVYQLDIAWRDTTYTATSELSWVAPMPSINFVPDNKTDSLSLGEFAEIYNPYQQAMYEVDVYWSHLTTVQPTQARMYFYTFSSVHINALIRPKKDKVLFPKGSIVVAKKYGLNDDFAAFLQVMAIETEWNGNLYYGASGQLPTNISGGAFGFFSTCAVVADTLIAR